MKKADFSTIVGAFITFLVFFLSIGILQYFISSNYKNFEETVTSMFSLSYDKLLENIEFLNNSTLASSPQINIKNTGKISLDLNCFSLYVDSLPTTFNFTINDLYNDNLLNPGENATIYISNTTTGWKKVSLVSCKGNKFETLINFQ